MPTSPAIAMTSLARETRRNTTGVAGGISHAGIALFSSLRVKRVIRSVPTALAGFLPACARGPGILLLQLSLRLSIRTTDAGFSPRLPFSPDKTLSSDISAQILYAICNSICMR